MSVNVITREELPPLIGDAIRRIRDRHPEYQARLVKRLAQFLGKSPSYADKAIRGDLPGYDGALLLNMNRFFDGLLLIEIEGGMDETERRELLSMARKIEGIANKWTFSRT